MASSVLVVDDHPLFRELIIELLELDGYRVLAAESAEVGLRLAATAEPVLILMDFQLPRMSGPEAIRRLKADPTTASIPVLALSGSGTEDDERRAREAGADAFLAKPMETAIFRETVGRLLARDGRE
jgi:CheY-like chemotaxis protein